MPLFPQGHLRCRGGTLRGGHGRLRPGRPYRIPARHEPVPRHLLGKVPPEAGDAPVFPGHAMGRNQFRQVGRGRRVQRRHRDRRARHHDRQPEEGLGPFRGAAHGGVRDDARVRRGRPVHLRELPPVHHSVRRVRRLGHEGIPSVFRPGRLGVFRTGHLGGRAWWVRPVPEGGTGGASPGSGLRGRGIPARARGRYGEGFRGHPPNGEHRLQRRVPLRVRGRLYRLPVLRVRPPGELRDAFCGHAERRTAAGGGTPLPRR